MLTISLVVGTVTGTAQAVAQALSARLIERGFSVVLIEDGRLPLDPGPWILCTSTTGAGDIPDNIWPFISA